MQRRVPRRIGAVFVVAFAFGLTLSVEKGNGGGVRDAVGNISAPWLLLPFVVGVVLGRGRTAVGAVVGLLATFVALAGFYLANSFVLDLGPHTRLDDVRLAVEGGKQYFVLALLSGPTFGALGAWWQRHRSTTLAVLVASLLVFEPLAWAAYERSAHSTLSDHPLVWAGEVIVGLLACVAVAINGRRRAGVHGQT
jgi:hypothetical protein